MGKEGYFPPEGFLFFATRARTPEMKWCDLQPEIIQCVMYLFLFIYFIFQTLSLTASGRYYAVSLL